MMNTILSSIYEFIRSYLTFILLLIVFIINYFILYLQTNTKDENITLQEYLLKSLKLQYIPLIFIIFIVIPAIFYLVYKLNTQKEKTRIVEIIFLYTIISGFYNLAKSIIIIYNNYDKASMATYAKNIEAPGKISIIYKSLINDDEYSNIDILYRIWFIPVVTTIVLILFQIIISFVFSNNTTNSFIIKYLFKKDTIIFNELTIEDIMTLISVFSGNFNNLYKIGNELGVDYLNNLLIHNPDLLDKFKLDKLNKLKDIAHLVLDMKKNKKI